MRIVRGLASILLFALMVVGALVGKAGPEWFGFVPTWVWWSIPVALVVFLGWTLLTPKARQRWRDGRAEARERQRKLTEFELD